MTIHHLSRIAWMGLLLSLSSALHASPNGAPGTPTPTPYGQPPAPAVYGAPSRNSGSAGPLLPALPRAASQPGAEQGLPALREPQRPVQLPQPKHTAPEPTKP